MELFAIEGEDCSPKFVKAIVNEKPKIAKRLHELARELLLYGPSIDDDKIYRRHQRFFHDLAKKKGDKKTLIVKGLRKARVIALCWMCRKCLEQRKKSRQSESSQSPTELTEKKDKQENVEDAS